MSTYLIALGLSLLGGLGGLLVASGVLLINDSIRARLIPWLVSYAVGALLGVSTLAAICARCHDLSRRFAFVAGVLAVMIALPAWMMRVAFGP